MTTDSAGLLNIAYSRVYSSRPPHRAEHAVTPYLKTGLRQRTAITSPAASILRLLKISSAAAEKISPAAQ